MPYPYSKAALDFVWPGPPKVEEPAIAEWMRRGLSAAHTPREEQKNDAAEKQAPTTVDEWLQKGIEGAR